LRHIGSLYLSLKPKFQTLVWNQKPISNRS